MAKPWAKKFYRSKEWQVTREYILKRDNYLCQRCGEPAEEIHHIIRLTPQNITDPKVTMNPDNLISLCKNCHFEEHKTEKIVARIKANKKVDEDCEYEFDENGFLIRKSPR